MYIHSYMADLVCDARYRDIFVDTYTYTNAFIDADTYICTYMYMYKCIHINTYWLVY